MVDTLGLPTVFFTHSAEDLQNLHGKIADTDTPLPVLHLGCQLTINSTTTPCQWNHSHHPLNPENYVKNPGRTLYTQCEHDFLHSTHKPSSRQSYSKTRQPNTTSTQPPTLCCPNPPSLGEISFSVLLLQNLNRAKLRVTWPGAWHKGAWQVKGHHGQPRGRCTWCSTHNPSWLQAVSVTPAHTHNQAHSTHQDTIFCSFSTLYKLGGFLECLQVVFSTLMLP